MRKLCPCNLLGHDCQIPGCSKEHQCARPNCNTECGIAHGDFQPQHRTCSLWIDNPQKHALKFASLEDCPRGHDLPELRKELMDRHFHACAQQSKWAKKGQIAPAKAFPTVPTVVESAIRDRIASDVDQSSLETTAWLVSKLGTPQRTAGTLIQSSLHQHSL